MSVSPAILLITLAVGVPLMLLALGVLYHAYLYSRQPIDALEEHVDSLATESAEDLLFALQEAVDEMQAQLAYQRETLAGMLSEKPQPAFATVAPLSLDIDGDRPTAAGEFVPRSSAPSPSSTSSTARPATRPSALPASLQATSPSSSQTATPRAGVRAQIAQLAETGMSDRAIARELHIGLEEVRIARMVGRQS